MKFKLFILIILILSISACNRMDNSTMLGSDSLYAWCIVPFDSLKRTPEQRISMLKRLSIKKYAYDWRQEHLETTAEEIELAREADIEINALWLWIDDNWDKVGKLNDANERLFKIIEEVNYHGEIWVSFNANYFDNLTDKHALTKGTEMIDFLSKKTEALGCKLALYNHGAWFGEPANQIKIIEVLPGADLGIIYNFHHAHPQIEAFPEMVSTMMPHLWHVNLNGLRQNGPKILTLGEGDYEKEFIELLIKGGYKGDFGILGHVENADVEQVLKANLNGLKKLQIKSGR